MNAHRQAVVNRSRSALRRRRTARGYLPPRSIEAARPDERAVLAEEHREILAALHRLAPRQREVLVLRYWSGLSEAEIARVMSPIGLDVGARTPEETAVAICAEIIALRTGRQVASLRDASGPIH